MTIGYGPTLFDDRFGLADRRPEALRDLPAFLGDDLDPARCGGDIVIQACSDDPQVAVHAVRNLVGWASASSRCGGASSASAARRRHPGQATPRNMFGFKDGTANITAEDTAALDEHVWVAPGMSRRGGLDGRRVVPRGAADPHAHRDLGPHPAAWSRSRSSGATRRSVRRSAVRAEFDEPDFAALGADGEPRIPVTAHVRLAHHSNLDGMRILRRGYNFTDGSDGQGHLDAGLFFIAFMRDAHRQFVPMQRALARADILNEYIEHTGSALFACPPGLAADDDWGSRLRLSGVQAGAPGGVADPARASATERLQQAPGVRRR